MRSFANAAATVLVLVAMLPGEVVASDRSMRCGGFLVYSGGGKSSSTMYEVLKKCGEPVQKLGNQWTYVQKGVTRTLIFEHQSRLLSIESSKT